MKNDSRTYSYYLDRFSCDLYEFDMKKECLRDYVIYMLDRTQRMFKYEGLPDTIPQRMLEMQLQVNGFSCIAKHGGELYAYWGGLGGEPDVYLRPTVCVVSNPAQKFSKTFKIDEDCVIVRNDSYLYGLLPLFRRYATAMVENDLSFKLASINSRIQALITAPDDTTAEAGNKYLEDIEDGKLGVIASNEFLDGLKAQPVQGSMRTFTDLIEYQQYLKASWYNEIGLNANYNMKREKLSTTESQMNSDALLPLVDDMLEQRRLGVERINEMFGTNITVDFDSSWIRLIEEMLSTQVDGGENDVSDQSRRNDEDISDSTGFEEIREIALPEPADEADSDGENQRGNEAERSSDSADENGSGDSSEKELGESSKESESTQVDSGDVEVNVEVTVNVGEEVNEDEGAEENSDRSVSEDERDGSGSDK